jgi:transposase
MPAPRKYPAELRERAIRLVLEAREQESELSLNAAVQRIGPRLGINKDTLRGWCKQAEIDAGRRSGVSTREASRIKARPDLDLDPYVQTSGAALPATWLDVSMTVSSTAVFRWADDRAMSTLSRLPALCLALASEHGPGRCDARQAAVFTCLAVLERALRAYGSEPSKTRRGLVPWAGVSARDTASAKRSTGIG